MRWVKGLGMLIGLLFGVVYILNPGAGMIEAIPDNLPIIGNLDEAAAVALIISCVQGLRALRANGKAKPVPELPPAKSQS